MGGTIEMFDVYKILLFSAVFAVCGRKPRGSLRSVGSEAEGCIQGRGRRVDDFESYIQRYA